MAQTRSKPNARLLIAAACGLGAAALVAFALLRDGAPDQTAALDPPEPAAAPRPPAAPESAATAAAPAMPQAPAPQATAQAAAAPSLDLVRVAPDGATLIAGRTTPGAEVAIRAGEATLATTLADASGAFVAQFDLAPETQRDLAVASAAPGAPEAEVALTLPEPQGFVPAAGGAAEPALAAAVPAAPPVEPAAAPAEPAAVARADRAAAVKPVPPAVAELEPAPSAIIAGAPDDAPAPAASPARPQGQTVEVRPGGTLWTLAREHYGAGRRYPRIVAANPDEIDDPALIFPGQRLVLPPPDPAD